jgi:hypothetical protein
MMAYCAVEPRAARDQIINPRRLQTKEVQIASFAPGASVKPNHGLIILPGLSR